MLLSLLLIGQSSQVFIIPKYKIFIEGQHINIDKDIEIQDLQLCNYAMKKPVASSIKWNSWMAPYNIEKMANWQNLFLAFPMNCYAIHSLGE